MFHAMSKSVLAPQTDADWDLALEIPGFARRIATIKLKGALNGVLSRPMWTVASLEDKQPFDAAWPFPHDLVPTFARALPLSWKRLGWDASRLPEFINYKQLFEALALGFGELFETQGPTDTATQPWPEGVNQERWLNDIRQKSGEFNPVLRLIDHWEKHLKEWAPTLLIHGSCATLDHVKGPSDLDTMLLISRRTLCDAQALENFVSEFHKSLPYLLEFNPYMHHAHMMVTELELGELREASLPLCLVRNGVTFGMTPKLSLCSETDLETLHTISIFDDFFNRRMTTVNDISTSFDLLWWMSSAVFLPVLFMQMKDGHSRWKPDALLTTRDYATPEEIRLLDHLTRVRATCGDCFPPLPEPTPASLPYAHAGRMIESQKEVTRLTPEKLALLGIDDSLVLQSRLMFQRMAAEATAIFSARHLKKGPLAFCTSALTGKSVIEPPEPIELSKYEQTKAWVVDFAKKHEDIVAVYQYGEVGCPGLSDVDILVVLRDEAAGSKPFCLADLPGDFQDVMGHDATFVSDGSLVELLKVFPLFEATLLYGQGPERIAAPLSAPETVLPLYTIALLAKYPSDLIFLSQLPEVRFKTLLAFLHSFKHFLPMYRCLNLPLPQAIQAALEKDVEIRGRFAEGTIPAAAELPEILLTMLRATAAVTASLDQAWKLFAGTSARTTLKLESLRVEFVENWNEDRCLSSFCKALSDGNSLIQMPSSLGGFVQWLSSDSGMASAAIKEEITPAHRTEGIFPSAYERLLPFRASLNAYACLELNSGRDLSKYVTLVNAAPAEAVSLHGGRTNGRAPGSILPDRVRTILLPRFDTLGDIVLLAGFVAALARRFPEAVLTLFVREGYQQLAPLFPSNIRWLTTPLHPYRFSAESDLQHLDALTKTIAGSQWDLALFTTYNRTWIDDVVAARLAGAVRLALGETRTHGDYFQQVREYLALPAEQPFDGFIPVDEWIHETEKYQHFWRNLFVGEPELPLPSLVVPGAASTRAEEILGGLGLADKPYFICAAVGGLNIPIKTWPVDRFAEAICRIHAAHGIVPLLVGHEAEAGSLQEVQQLVQEMGGPTTFKWIGTDGEIGVLAALMERAQIYLGNDSGPMHISAALGVPTIGIFGGGHYPRFLPAGKKVAEVAVKLPCYGCGWDCIFGDAPCIKTVEVGTVTAIVDSILHGSQAPIEERVIDRTDDKVLQQIIGSAKRMIDSLDAQVHSLRVESEASAEELRAQLRQQTEVISQLTSSLSAGKETLETARASLDARLAAAENEITALRSSLSWRITAPLRSMYSKIFSRSA